MPKRKKDDFEEWNPDGLYVLDETEEGETLQYIVPQPQTDLIDSYQRVNPGEHQFSHDAPNDPLAVHVEEPTLTTEEDPEKSMNE